MSEFQDCIPWQKKYYCDIKIPHLPNSIKCITCGLAYSGEKTNIIFYNALIHIT